MPALTSQACGGDCKSHNLTSPLLTMLLCQHMAVSSSFGHERKFPIAMNPTNAGLCLQEFGKGSQARLSGLEDVKMGQSGGPMLAHFTAHRGLQFPRAQLQENVSTASSSQDEVGLRGRRF